MLAGLLSGRFIPPDILDIKREDIMNQCIHFAEFKRTRKLLDGTEMEVTKDDDLKL